MYHGVGHVPRERDPHGMFVTAAAFRDQIEWLLEHDFNPLSEADFLAALSGLTAPRKSVLITFDDGYLGVGEYAAPILHELGVPSILFVPSRLLGGVTEWLATENRHPLMSADELADGPVDGDGHRRARTRPSRPQPDGRSRPDPADGRARATSSRLRSACRSGHSPIPSAVHSAAARAAVRDAGYDAAFAVHDGAGRFAIARTDVNATDTPVRSA